MEPQNPENMLNFHGLFMGYSSHAGGFSRIFSWDVDGIWGDLLEVLLSDGCGILQLVGNIPRSSHCSPGVS